MKENKFPPSAFKKEINFVDYQDLIEIVTDPDKLYTKAELSQIVKSHLSKEVD